MKTKLTNTKKLLLLIFAVLSLAIFVQNRKYTGESYRPHLVAKSNQEILVATKPESFLEASVRFFKVQFDISGKCKYLILGWDDDNRLYYDSECNRKLSRFVYDPQLNNTETAKNTPELLFKESVPSDLLLDSVGFLHPITPASAAVNALPLYLLEDSGVYSPDGKYVAFIQQAIYSEYDVTIIETNQ